jgi:hypothetical protein
MYAEWYKGDLGGGSDEVGDGTTGVVGEYIL